MDIHHTSLRFIDVVFVDALLDFGFTDILCLAPSLLSFAVLISTTSRSVTSIPPSEIENNNTALDNMSLTIPNSVPQRPFCYLNFISVAKPQKFGNTSSVWLNPKSLEMKRMMSMPWQTARHTESKISLKSGFRTH